MNEIWTELHLEDVVDLYEVSNFGKVRRKACIYTDKNGIKYNYKERYLKPIMDKWTNREKMTLSRISQKTGKFPLDYLVAITYVENPNKYPIIEHLDGNILNCRADNLKWVTYENNSDYDQTESLDGEIWKPIKGFETKYHASNFGRIKSLSRNVLKAGCDLPVGKPAYILVPTIEERSGYASVGLSTGNETVTFRVHRLIAETFIPNPENKPTIDHIDQNKLNNSVENLRWATHKENNNNGGASKLRITFEDGSYKEYSSIKEASRDTKIASGTISKNCRKNITSRSGWKFEYLEESKHSVGQKSRRKGNAFEREIVQKLNSLGFNVTTSRNESKKLDNNKIDIADLDGTLPTNIQAKYTATTPNYYNIRNLCTDTSKPFTIIWKKSNHGKHSPGTLAMIPVEFFYELLQTYLNKN